MEPSVCGQGDAATRWHVARWTFGWCDDPLGIGKILQTPKLGVAWVLGDGSYGCTKVVRTITVDVMGEKLGVMVENDYTRLAILLDAQPGWQWHGLATCPADRRLTCGA